MADTAAVLACNTDALRSEYDVVILGSGYGGAITAARLATANAAAGGKLDIAVLERGAEHPTGTFPETEKAALGELRSRSNPLGLIEIERFKTIDVIHASGLGGTSLINFNVAIVPDREVFLASWPREFRALVEQQREGVGGLDEYFGRARRMLGAVPYAENVPLRRVEAFTQIAKNAGAQLQILDITVSAEDRVTRYGVQRRRCPNHGGDGTGDNTGSKNTLMTNYLPMAAHRGAQMFCGIEAERIEAADDGRWRVIAGRTGRKGQGSRKGQDGDVVITARHVVVCAGTLGSNGILMRSRDAGLKLSGRLGKNFSGNGDNFAIAYNTDMRTDTQTWATTDGPPRSELACGPSITAVMRFGADQSDVRKRFTVEDLSLPRALVDSFRLGLMGLAAASYRDLRPTKLDRWRRDVTFNIDGAMNHSLGFLIMVHDNSDGELVLRKNGTVKVDWPGAPTEAVYRDVDAIMKPAVEAIGGTYIKNPRWDKRFLGKHLITAHPMGGCATADNVDAGVVDHAGRVYHPDGGTYDGLYVCDASVIPRAIGVNPFLTISMFAERTAELMRRELGLPGYDPVTELDDRV
ncbi:Cholesterol oxidase [Mycobacterium marinum]|uniref:GMC oxidoreductase n=1 Tax=Mycobacterium marinum TaxID=1781 RepID=UPI0003588820|nr:GMC oxidoreductase [Mycobacterium marinum]AXN51160.1 Cholesterol oxidase [Mycobacterium marinum]EPQ74782.1 Cholesterol oxidase [Mycobacterium marinum str. Europe]RFZ02717.1 Cholesterol oxidase [Mycobacterium marinum]RFZ25906.1 Cholesterol oxidase [Mycobacterium marinum]RFZ28786.1 Cholesterol oxidase [Mycobacterium marinum]